MRASARALSAQLTGSPVVPLSVTISSESSPLLWPFAMCGSSGAHTAAATSPKLGTSPLSVLLGGGQVLCIPGHMCFAQRGQGRLHPWGILHVGRQLRGLWGGDIPRAVIGCAKGFKRVAPSGQREANICRRVCVFRDVIALEMRKPRFKHVKLKGTQLEGRKARSQIQV